MGAVELLIDAVGRLPKWTSLGEAIDPAVLDEHSGRSRAQAEGQKTEADEDESRVVEDPSDRSTRAVSERAGVELGGRCRPA